MSHKCRRVVETTSSEHPDLLEPFDDAVIGQIAENIGRRNVDEKRLAEMVLSHQRSIHSSVPESRYIELRHLVKQFACFENEIACFFIVPPSVWSLERSHTDFTENELKRIAFVHTHQTRKCAEEGDQTEALELLEDRFGFIVYKPPFMKRAYTLHQETLLSEREAEVQALVEEGHSSKKIANVLGISTGTVDSIRYNRIARKASKARATVDLLDSE